jgi:hypothetical protein
LVRIDGWAEALRRACRALPRARVGEDAPSSKRHPSASMFFRRRSLFLETAAGTRPSQGFASIFVTAPDGLKLHVRRYGFATLLRNQLYAYLVSAAPQPTFIPWRRHWQPILPVRDLC